MEFEHLRNKNISYLGHMFRSFCIACMLFTGAFGAIIHGIYPNVCKNTARDYATFVADTDSELH